MENYIKYIAGIVFTIILIFLVKCLTIDNRVNTKFIK